MSENLDDIIQELDDEAWLRKINELKLKIRGQKAIGAKVSHLQKQLIKLTKERLMK